GIGDPHRRFVRLRRSVVPAGNTAGDVRARDGRRSEPVQREHVDVREGAVAEVPDDDRRRRPSAGVRRPALGAARRGGDDRLLRLVPEGRPGRRPAARPRREPARILAPDGLTGGVRAVSLNLSAVHSRVARRCAAALFVATMTFVALAPAGAQVDPAVTQLADDLAAVRHDLDATNARIVDIRDQSALMQGRISDLSAHIDEFRAQIAQTEAQIQTLEANREAILEVVRARAARVYVERDPVSPFDTMLLNSPMRLARSKKLAGAVA